MLQLGVTGLGEPGLSRLALLSLVIKSPSSVTQPISENHKQIKASNWLNGSAGKTEMRSEAWK